jgi:hypothetical protein
MNELRRKVLLFLGWLIPSFDNMKLLILLPEQPNKQDKQYEHAKMADQHMSGKR